MTVHSFHIFDRKGKTLFTKRYIKSPGPEDEEQLSEQRKLIFGMLFSLRELSNSLSPTDETEDIQLVKTGASTLYNYETVSGLRFVMYTTADTSVMSTAALNAPPGSPVPPSGPGSSGAGGLTSHMTNSAVTENIRAALKHIYEHIWVTFVVRSPLYRPYDPNISSTNFEASLDNFLKATSWFH